MYTETRGRAIFAFGGPTPPLQSSNVATYPPDGFRVDDELIDSSTIEVAPSRGRNLKAIWQDSVDTNGANNLLDN